MQWSQTKLLESQNIPVAKRATLFCLWFWGPKVYTEFNDYLMFSVGSL